MSALEARSRSPAADPTSFTPEALALPLLRATQAAAIACVPWTGGGDREGADAVAVAAMRAALAEVPGRGRVVIGEGEKDAAPMLYAGEELGAGDGPAFELAVDPLEGTSFCARGVEGAVCVLAAAPPGALCATSGWYMDKLVVGPEAAGVIDLSAGLDDNLDRIAAALEKTVDRLVVAVLDKPRHVDLVARLRARGVAVVQIPDGDMMGALRALVPAGGLDACLGVGGAPEGVITACAVRLLGGDMQGRLAPQSDEERARLDRDGVDVDRVLTLDDLASNPDCVFIATGVTAGPFLSAPEPLAPGWRVRSLVSAPRHPWMLVDGWATGHDADG